MKINGPTIRRWRKGRMRRTAMPGPRAAGREGMTRDSMKVKVGISSKEQGMPNGEGSGNNETTKCSMFNALCSMFNKGAAKTQRHKGPRRKSKGKSQNHKVAGSAKKLVP